MYKVVKEEIPSSVKYEIREKYPELSFYDDYGFQGKRFTWMGGTLSEKQYLLFLVEYGHYF